MDRDSSLVFNAVIEVLRQMTAQYKHNSNSVREHKKSFCAHKHTDSAREIT